jgi:PPOX class probable F420-dependent enzyme
VGSLPAAAARERFAAARVARLATVRPGGGPHVVPIVFAVIGDTIYSAVDDKPKRTARLARLAHIAAEPAVSLIADHYEEDWSRLWWARADGRARELGEADEDERRRAAARLGERYPQQRVVGAMIAVDVERWSGWSAAGAGGSGA